MRHDATRALILAAAIAALGAAPQNTATSPPRTGEIQKVRENLYVLSGGGGNTVVFVTDLGVVLVDTKLAGQGQAIVDKIKTITPKPVATIINTHSHVDHTGGNEFFPLSVEIVAQENTRLNMDKLDAYKGDKTNYLPKLMFKEKMSLGGGRDRVNLYFFGRG